MDIMQSQDKKCPPRNCGVIVMVRAAGDEPVLLSVIEKSADFIELEGSQPGNTINFRKDLVYSYNPSIFAELQAAYSAQDVAKIEANWKRCDLYD